MSVLALLSGTAQPASLALRELDQALHSKPDLGRGSQLFATCAACHGAQAGGTEDGLVPRIAGQHFSVIVRQLVDYRYGKRWDIRMEQVASIHSLADGQSIADVASYISALPPPGRPGVGSGEQVAHGAQVYARLCQSCHGAGGEGSAADGVPQLAAQHFEYLLRQMHDGIEARRPNFPKSHIRLLSGLVRDDLVGLADYLSRLPQPEPR